MADQSKIEWTDATWNPVRGCTKVSPGCKNCYAETFAERFRGVPGHPYEQGFDLRLVPEKLKAPVTWKPKRIFVNSMSDLFQDGVPDTFIDSVYETMEQLAPQHIYQVLTKRAQRMHDYLNWRYGGHRIPSRHIWHGVSVEDQRRANERVPLLMDTRSAVRFISAEPLLGPVNLDGVWGYPGSARAEQLAQWPIHWLIVGGESGGCAREHRLEWSRSLLRQCRNAGVAFFMKQAGVHVTTNYYDNEMRCVVEDRGEDWPDSISWHERDGQPSLSDCVRLHFHKKGGVLDELPADLRVREYPEAKRWRSNQLGGEG